MPALSGLLLYNLSWQYYQAQWNRTHSSLFFILYSFKMNVSNEQTLYATTGRLKDWCASSSGGGGGRKVRVREGGMKSMWESFWCVTSRGKVAKYCLATVTKPVSCGGDYGVELWLYNLTINDTDTRHRLPGCPGFLAESCTAIWFALRLRKKR